MKRYRMLEKDPDHFASSPASIGEYIKVFQEAHTEADGILMITLSTKLSTLYNVVHLARNGQRNYTRPPDRDFGLRNCHGWRRV